MGVGVGGFPERQPAGMWGFYGVNSVPLSVARKTKNRFCKWGEKKKAIQKKNFFKNKFLLLTLRFTALILIISIPVQKLRTSKTVANVQQTNRSTSSLDVSDVFIGPERRLFWA